ncbi:MAG: hypothetical protein K2H30_02965 [Clostridia bacterium]|nr:hypothetical protein [Clostridia bacterium]
MKYCKNCGRELSDEAILCTGCGCATDEFNANQAVSQQNGEISTMALLGFIFSFLSSLVGLILSCIAYKTAVRENDEKSKTYSKAGIIISSVLMGLGVVIGIIYGVVVAGLIIGSTMV